jgi:Zn-dependent protease with chaperone function
MTEKEDKKRKGSGFPRLKLALMFLVLWFLLVGIALAISAMFGYGSYSWVFLAIISIFIIILNLVTYFYSDKMVLKAYKGSPETRKNCTKGSRHGRAAHAQGSDCPIGYP